MENEINAILVTDVVIGKKDWNNWIWETRRHNYGSAEKN